MGNAVDNDALLLQPHQLLDLMPLLARLYHEGMDRGLLMVVGNNIGYFGPYEHLWRTLGQEPTHWSGCSAGQTVIGLESDGTVKGCPSLATVGYAGGNVRDLSLEDIWSSSEAIHFGRLRSVEDLWGFCRTCYYAEVCRGGCTWTADSLFGRPGNNPYCHYRALELEKRGLRERVVKKREAPLKSFATGEFELILEPIAGREAEAGDGLHETATPASPLGRLVQIGGMKAASSYKSGDEGRVPPSLEICHACNGFVWPGEVLCPHCGSDIAAAAVLHSQEARRRQELIAEVEELIRKAQEDGSRRTLQAAGARATDHVTGRDLATGAAAEAQLGVLDTDRLAIAG
jgi:radical SAM protein with 4Fe4S-binding SPASM domain